jgi:sugar lactone lactonase YvrE
MAMSVDCLVRGRDLLGECPLWDERSGTLWWVDILGPALKKLVGGSVVAYPLPEPMGSFAFRERGGLLGAMKSGLYFFDPEKDARERFARPDEHPADQRFNDGRCDRAGRFWVGTMTDPERKPVGTLYRVSREGACARIRGDLFVPNSLAWSPDSRTMYFADSVRDVIWSFDYDIEDGTLANERVFVEGARNPGYPDGSCVDAEGCLWNAEYGGWRVTRYTPAGKIDQVIELPVQNPTCCCFGGARLDTLYITSAAQELSADALKKQELAGSVFAVRPGAIGLPEARFAG